MPIVVRAQACRRIAPPVLRLTVNGILWRMRTGGPWRFVPAEYGNWSSIRRRFQEWDEAGLWRAVTTELAEIRDGRRVTRPIYGSTGLGILSRPAEPQADRSGRQI